MNNKCKFFTHHRRRLVKVRGGRVIKVDDDAFWRRVERFKQIRAHACVSYNFPARRQANRLSLTLRRASPLFFPPRFKRILIWNQVKRMFDTTNLFKFIQSRLECYDKTRRRKLRQPLGFVLNFNKLLWLHGELLKYSVIAGFLKKKGVGEGKNSSSFFFNPPDFFSGK